MNENDICLSCSLNESREVPWWEGCHARAHARMSESIRGDLDMPPRVRRVGAHRVFDRRRRFDLVGVR